MTLHPSTRARAVRLAAIVALTLPAAASCQGSREQALAALRSAADAGDVRAQVALGGLLDRGGAERDDEALQWYEKAARAGDRVAQRRYLDMLARPPRKDAAPSGGFMIRLPRNADAGDALEPPADLPPGYHCHFLGHGQMWCHGGPDASR
jgi:TPR repeat protein